MLDARAVVDPGARVGDGVTVGAFSIVEQDVEIGDGTWIGPHVVIRSGTRIGRDNKIFQFASVGECPQHMGYAGERTRLQIGDRNVVREFCTLHRGTAEGDGVTSIGDDNFLMAYVHIAHDCNIGNRTIFANCASLAGHVEVQDYAILGGFTLVHQFCRIGAHCITAIGSVCLKDVPPYVVAAGNTASPYGINVKGLRRRQFSDEAVTALHRAYRDLYRRSLDLRTAIDTLERNYNGVEEVASLAEFLRTSQRGIIR